MGRPALFKPRADWVLLVERLYEPTPDTETWARSVVDAMRAVFPLDDDGGAAMVVLEHDPSHAAQAIPLVVGVGRSAQFNLAADVDPLGRQLFDALFYSRSLALTHSEAMRKVGRRSGAPLDQMHTAWGFADALGMVARPEPGVIAFLARPLRTPAVLTRHERKVMSQAALHFESAFRLRRRPEAVLAVLTPDGKVLHREREDLAGPAVSERVRRIERSRTRAERRSPQAIDVWSALLAGEASIVERFDGGKRYYVVLDNPPSRRAHRALTRREIEIVRMAARGLPNKLVAYGLGLSSPAVSNGLASAAAKLGLPTALDLVRAASLLIDTPRAPVNADDLSPAERAIFDLVRLGLSNAEIAQQRSRSVRTVANQVASILRKTGSATRRGVVTTPST